LLYEIWLTLLPHLSRISTVDTFVDRSKSMQHLACNRWLGLAAACLMMTMGGTLYGFAAVSHNLKILMDYSQYEINFVGTMGTVGSLLGIFPGIFYDYFGARPTCIIASILVFTGYFLTYLSLQHTIYSTYWLLGIYFVLVGLGASAGYTAALSTNIKNFNRKHRGKIVGILTSLFAISSAMYSTIYKYAFKQNLLPYLLFLAIASGSVPAIGFIFLNVVERKKKITVEDDEFTFTNTAPRTSFEGTDAEGAVQDAAEDEEEKLYLFANSPSRVSGQSIKTDYDSEISELLKEGVKQSEPPVIHEYNPLQLLISLDFWLLFVALFSGFGSALMITNVSFAHMLFC
jgi:MFS family permease